MAWMIGKPPRSTSSGCTLTDPTPSAVRMRSRAQRSVHALAQPNVWSGPGVDVACACGEWRGGGVRARVCGRAHRTWGSKMKTLKREPSRIARAIRA